MGAIYRKCDSCKKQNTDYVDKCVFCGKLLFYRVCGYCRIQNRSNARFCKSCGQQLPAIKIFFSYAHEDESLREKLAKHLNLLKRENLITTWHDRNISAGTSWSVAINENLLTADIILLLISADFITSDYCYSIEMKHALKRCKDREATVIPIILRPVDWHTAPFAEIQALPQDAKPVIKWSYEDDAFLSIANGIREVIRTKYTL